MEVKSLKSALPDSTIRNQPTRALSCSASTQILVNSEAQLRHGIDTEVDSPGNTSFSSQSTSTILPTETEISSPDSQAANSPLTSAGSFPNHPVDLASVVVDLTKDDEETSDDSPVTNTDRVSLPSFFTVDDYMTDEQITQWLKSQQRGNPTGDLAEAIVNDIVYRPSMSLELKNGNYLRIDRIRCRRKVYFLYGRHLMKSTAIVESCVPRCRGELIWLPQRTEPICMDQVKSFCKIQFTNFRRRHWQDHDGLVCRLKMTQRTRDMVQTDLRESLVSPELAIEYLAFEETDQNFGFTAQELRDNWRGANRTTPFGEAEISYSEMIRQQPLLRRVIDLENTDPEHIDLTDSRLRTYTFGDAYCGAGGASCGARKAGLELRWAFDAEAQAVSSYRCNFPDTTVWNATANDFINIDDPEIRVDICHASPPCQPFSPAHTVSNQPRDEINSACVFTAADLLNKVRPRILTMEETFGLQQRWKEIFHRVILDFVEIGYSVRWAVLECVNYGVPQYRRRLIILVAGPGETLPELPPPTHALPGAGLAPLKTIADAIDNIPLDAEDHDVEKGLRSFESLGYRTPYNKNQPARTITCSGGDQNYHPSGRRGFTAREFACLQTFPLDFQFSEKKVRKQIGNAVPPKFAEAVFREVCRSLRETDEREMRNK